MSAKKERLSLFNSRNIFEPPGSATHVEPKLRHNDWKKETGKSGISYSAMRSKTKRFDPKMGKSKSALNDRFYERGQLDIVASIEKTPLKYANVRSPVVRPICEPDVIGLEKGKTFGIYDTDVVTSNNGNLTMSRCVSEGYVKPSYSVMQSTANRTDVVKPPQDDVGLGPGSYYRDHRPFTASTGSFPRAARDIISSEDFHEQTSPHRHLKRILKSRNTKRASTGQSTRSRSAEEAAQWKLSHHKSEPKTVFLTGKRFTFTPKESDYLYPAHQMKLASKKWDKSFYVERNIERKPPSILRGNNASNRTFTVPAELAKRCSQEAGITLDTGNKRSLATNVKKSNRMYASSFKSSDSRMSKPPENDRRPNVGPGSLDWRKDGEMRVWQPDRVSSPFHQSSQRQNQKTDRLDARLLGSNMQTLRPRVTHTPLIDVRLNKTSPTLHFSPSRSRADTAKSAQKVRSSNTPTKPLSTTQ